MISTLNKYIALQVFLGILTAFAIITSIIMLVDFVEISRNFGSDTHVSMPTVLIITALNAPKLVEQTIPFTVLFGVMAALFGLNKRSEIIVMRASGLSAWKFLKPAVLVTGVLGIIWAMAFNPLAEISSRKYESVIRAASGDKNASQTIKKDVWLREGDEDGHLVIHAKSADVLKHTLNDVTFYYLDFDKDGKPSFSVRYDAQSAELFKNNYWVLSSVTENEDGKATKHYSIVSKSTNISWETLRAQTQTNKSPPFWKIRSEISKARQAGFDTSPLILQFHKLLALPITLIAMSIIAACAALNMTRSGGTLRLLILGSGLGFGVYFADNIIGAFGETGALPPVLAAWTVPLLVLSLGLAFLTKIEDG